MKNFLHLKSIAMLLALSLICSCFLFGCTSVTGNGGAQNNNSADASQNDTAASSFDKYSKISKTGFFFSTVVSVTLYGTSDETILEDCFLCMNDYEKMLSKTVEGSDIWNINHSEGTAVEVSEETAVLLRMADSFSKLSEGAFDLTVAPVVSLWDFTGEEPHTVPSETDIKEALSHVDYQNLTVDGTTVTLLDSAAEVDPGAIAKGFIADRIKSWLLERGVTCGLISLGGNVLTFGSKPDGSPWNIAIRKPFGESSESITTVSFKDGKSIVTSGTYERYFEQDGVIYHHILNPDTGYPVSNGLTSVTILSNSSAEGDALSTACFVLGLEKGMELIESRDGIEALFITEDLNMHKSSGFPG